MVNGVDLWYRRTFRLTPNDPRYINTTRKERLTEYWAWQFEENPKLLDAVEDDSFDMEEIQRQWAEEAGEEPGEIIKPHPLEPEIDPDDVDDWEDM